MDGKLSIKDIKDPYVRENLAVLLETQSIKDPVRELLGEESTFSTTTPSSEDSGQFKPIALALVRRTFPDLFANKVVPVQAMNGPVGLAFALRFMYKDGTSGYDPNREAAFNSVNIFSGFTGSTSGASATADSGTGVSTTEGESWQLNPGTGQMPELKLMLSRTAIEAKSRKLAASFSLEAAQDIKAMHDIDVEREMVNVLQYEVLAELDRELVAKLKNVAVDPTKGGFAAATIDVSGSDGRWSQEKFAVVANTIVAQANNIAISTRRGAGNFVIVSPRVATALQAAGRQFFTNNSANVAATTVLSEVGNINGVITVYRDSYASSDYALTGYKGPGISDGGVVYSPYIMGLLSKAIQPDDFSPRVGVMSRYALTDSLLGAGRYYRLNNYTNLDKVLGI